MSNPSQRTIANCLRASEQEYRDDPFGKFLENLNAYWEAEEKALLAAAKGDAS